MSTTSPHQRVFALLGAVLILVTAVASGIFVIWQVQQDKKNAAVSETTTQGGNKLEGTKLTDFTPVSKVEKLEYTDTVVGTGKEATPGSTVTAHYTGAVASTGTIFQSSFDAGQPIPFSLNEVIKGWSEGVPGMKVGGKRRILIPAEQAYGAQSRPGIPANSDLVFDIELVDVQ